jgi:hypothetical protein
LPQCWPFAFSVSGGAPATSPRENSSGHASTSEPSSETYIGTSPISRTPRARAYVRSAVHSRSNRTWSAIAPEPANLVHSPIQYG